MNYVFDEPIITAEENEVRSEKSKLIYDIAIKEKLTLECMLKRLQEVNKDPSKAVEHMHVLSLTTEALSKLDDLKLK